MRHAGRSSWLVGAIALLAVAALGGCQNPLDPLDKTDKIEGLSYVDFSATWERWDADPEYDGMSISMDYYNEFSDSLSFHDKPHNIVIEMWSQKDTGTETQPFLSWDKLIWSRTFVFSNSDDSIRIPIESYRQALLDADITDETSGEAKGFMVVRVFPPEEYPRAEMPPVAYSDTIFFKPEVAEGTPNQ